MTKFGEAIVRVEYDDGLLMTGRRVVVDRADDTILVSRKFLDAADGSHYSASVLTLDTAGEYRYRRLGRLDAYVDVFVRVDAHGDIPSCTCRHVVERHPRGGRCTGRDSYDQPCACPAYDRDPNEDAEES